MTWFKSLELSWAEGRQAGRKSAWQKYSWKAHLRVMDDERHLEARHHEGLCCFARPDESTDACTHKKGITNMIRYSNRSWRNVPSSPSAGCGGMWVCNLAHVMFVRLLWLRHQHQQRVQQMQRQLQCWSDKQLQQQPLGSYYGSCSCCSDMSSNGISSSSGQRQRQNAGISMSCSSWGLESSDQAVTFGACRRGGQSMCLAAT